MGGSRAGGARAAAEAMREREKTAHGMRAAGTLVVLVACFRGTRGDPAVGAGPLKASILAELRVAAPAHLLADEEAVESVLARAPHAACIAWVAGGRKQVLESIADPADVWSVQRPIHELGIPGLRFRCRVGWRVPARIAVIVPTHAADTPLYAALAHSALQIGLGTKEPWDFVTIFSSLRDLAVMMPLARVSELEARFVPQRALVFDRPGVRRADPSAKYVYQTCKKMWAWSHLHHDFMLIMDSDFRVLRPVDLAADVIEPWARGAG